MNIKDFLPSRQTVVASVIGTILATLIIRHIPALRALTKD